MLDAIVQREWEYRYYSFNTKWADGEQMASMRNGQGDGWFCVFGAPGVFLKGFDHESDMSPWKMEVPKVWPGVLESVPEVFKPCVEEPALSPSETTFCIWRTQQDTRWNTGNVAYPGGDDPDGSSWMLSILDGNARTYREWAENYFECSIGLSPVQQVYEQKPLTPDLVRELNASIVLASLLDDASEIGYPVAPS